MRAGIDEGSLGVLARLAGLDVPPEDIQPLLAALRSLLAAADEVAAAELDGFEPITAFDPRWR